MQHAFISLFLFVVGLEDFKDLLVSNLIWNNGISMNIYTGIINIVDINIQRHYIYDI